MVASAVDIDKGPSALLWGSFQMTIGAGGAGSLAQLPKNSELNHDDTTDTTLGK